MSKGIRIYEKIIYADAFIVMREMDRKPITGDTLVCARVTTDRGYLRTAR